LSVTEETREWNSARGHTALADEGVEKFVDRNTRPSPESFFIQPARIADVPRRRKTFGFVSY